MNYSLTANQPARKKSTASAPVPAQARSPAPLGKYQTAAARQIDPTTLYGKLVFGYQGWFSAAGDGSPLHSWNHWSRDRKQPDVNNVRVQLWPDLSEYETDELYDTGLRYPDGSVAKLYSAWNLKTVMRHLRWMRDYNLDGALHYRFISRLSTHPEVRVFYDKVLDNIRKSAEAHGRIFAAQYDISDYTGRSIVADIENDWMALVDGLQVTLSPAYLHHRGKPLLVLRNFGMAGGTRLITPEEATQLIAWFKSNAPEKYRVTLMGALPGYWRTQGRDAKPDPGWPAVFRSFDVISGWPVGRFRDEAGADKWRDEVVIPDMKECARLGIDYIPTVFPGYSYHNADSAKPYNDKPRLGGRFYWHQVHNVVSANATMIYNAMFDEVDEGTAMYKAAPSVATQPVLAGGRCFLPLDADGEMLPSDWYLKLADYAGRMLRKEIAPILARPIDP
ncbi:MAG: glycoside hydrolase family 71/99-like protein [Planctomycetes bacterium]|nr:glycoside hydrolase family 71/99-like protein [Planctomycetota bacterium]